MVLHCAATAEEVSGKPHVDSDCWERRWQHAALSEHPDKVLSRPPNEYLLAEIGDLQSGLALDPLGAAPRRRCGSPRQVGGSVRPTSA